MASVKLYQLNNGSRLVSLEPRSAGSGKTAAKFSRAGE